MSVITYACGCAEEPTFGMLIGRTCPMHGQRATSAFIGSPRLLAAAFSCPEPKPLPPGGLFYPNIPGMVTWKMES